MPTKSFPKAVYQFSAHILSRSSELRYPTWPGVITGCQLKPTWWGWTVSCTRTCKGSIHLTSHRSKYIFSRIYSGEVSHSEDTLAYRQRWILSVYSKHVCASCLFLKTPLKQIVLSRLESSKFLPQKPDILVAQQASGGQQCHSMSWHGLTSAPCPQPHCSAPASCEGSRDPFQPCFLLICCVCQISLFSWQKLS